jgi:salicylate hydroxylase
MALEDAAVLGECLSRLSSTSKFEKKHVLAVYEKCRQERTRVVVLRGNSQQYLYHFHDGPEQEERDMRMQMCPTEKGEALAWRDPGFSPWLLGYDYIKDVSAQVVCIHVGVWILILCVG